MPASVAVPMVSVAKMDNAKKRSVATASAMIVRKLSPRVRPQKPTPIAPEIVARPVRLVVTANWKPMKNATMATRRAMTVAAPLAKKKPVAPIVVGVARRRRW